MAHIIKDDNSFVTKGASGIVDQVDFFRQLDIYRLALRGDGQCRRLWNDYASQDPGGARLVIKYDAAGKADRENARREIDDVLVKAENLTPGRIGRKSKAERKAKASLSERNRQKTLRASLASDLRHPDPRVREIAKRALERG